MTTSLPICNFCKHFTDKENLKCKAFPVAIPEQIYFKAYDHRKPYEGDNGKRFKLVDDETKRESYEYFLGEQVWTTEII